MATDNWMRWMPEIDGTGVQVACTCTEVTCQEGNVLAEANTGASRRTRPGPGSLALLWLLPLEY